MKTITRDFLDQLFLDTIIEYSRERFISDEEFDSLKKIFVNRFSEKILFETIDEQKITLTLENN